MALSTISFHEFSRKLSAFSLYSSGLISGLLVLSTAYLFTKVSLRPEHQLTKEITLSPNIIHCGCLGSKHQLTKLNWLPLFTRSGELRTLKLKSHPMRTQSLSVLLLKPRIGQYIAIHATLTARDFFLAYFYPSLLPVHSSSFFPKPVPVFPVLAVANTWFLCRPAE